MEIDKLAEELKVLNKKCFDITEEARNTRNCELFYQSEDLKVEIKNKQQILDNLLIVPVRYYNATLDNYKPSKNDLESFEIVRYYAELLPQSSIGLYLKGSVGNGKTHLFFTIIKSAIIKSMPVKCYLFSVLKNYSFSDRERIIKEISQSKLVGIDDIREVATSEYSVELLYTIVNECYNRMIPLIITTNMSDDKLKSVYGVATYSRLIEMCRPVVFVGEDYRTKKEAKNG